MKRRNIITVVIFLILLFSLTLFNLFTPDREFSENENRVLATFPNFSLGALAQGKFTDGFEKYITDQFVQRDLFVSIKTGTDLVAGKKDNGKVYFGKDGYLFQKNDKWTKEMLEKNMAAVTMFTESLKKLGSNADVKTLLVPSSGQILKDKLPDFLTLPNEDEVFDYANKTLASGSLIDIRPTFLKDTAEQLYYRTDHHWTTDGAYLAYTEWAKATGLTPYTKSDFMIQTVSDSFLGTSYSKAVVPMAPDSIVNYLPNFPFSVSVKLNDVDGVFSSLYFEKALETKDKYVYFLDGNHGFTTIDTSVKNGKSVLIIKDSFANSFVPFLALHYEHVYMVDLRYSKDDIAKFTAENKVDDVLFLYGIDTFTTDLNLAKLMR